MYVVKFESGKYLRQEERSATNNEHLKQTSHLSKASIYDEKMREQDREFLLAHFNEPSLHESEIIVMEKKNFDELMDIRKSLKL